MATETKREKTKICALNLDEALINYLSERFDVYKGSLGQRIDVSKLNIHGLYLLPHDDIPENIHEYEVFIGDMQNDSLIPYVNNEHTKTCITGYDAYYLYSESPQTVYNMRPYGAYILKEELLKHRERPAIKIVFQAKREEFNYIIKDPRWYQVKSNETHHNYEYLTDFCREAACGKEVKLVDDKLSRRLFEPFLNDISYCQTYYFPKKWDSESSNSVPDEAFVPLLKNRCGEIVSFAYINTDEITIILPQTKRKVELLDRVFQEIVFKNFSDYFPEVKESMWLNNAKYSLPNHELLIQNKEDITEKYNTDIKNIDKEIEKNKQKYGFLHTLLTATDSELVQAMITYLQWLGFSNVIDKDHTRKEGKPLEEDIQIDLGENGLLVIEVKGIGGTSTDSECSQIHKIVYRRARERNKFDVHGLYIVNNELHKEPLKRTIPPFTEEQKTDAINDNRGLAYTWQFFNLYFAIEDGIITKEDARTALLKDGVIEFSPNLINVGVPYKFYKNNTVACLEIAEKTIKVGDYFYYCIDGRWRKAKVTSIQKNKEEVSITSNGEFGFGVEHKIPSNTSLYIKGSEGGQKGQDPS